MILGQSLLCELPFTSASEKKFEDWHYDTAKKHRISGANCRLSLVKDGFTKVEYNH